MPKIQGEKVHVPNDPENADSWGYAPPLWRPGCDNVHLDRDRKTGESHAPPPPMGQGRRKRGQMTVVIKS